MEHREFEIMLADEKKHWWYRARHRLVEGALKDLFQGAIRPKILDVASACGANFEHYDLRGDVFGIDIAEESIAFCRKKGIETIVRGDVHRLPFSGNTFDAVLALDALEHFRDDILVLKELFRVLRHNGILVITAPAFRLFWSQHDEAFHHKRRYTLAGMKGNLRRCGYHLISASYWSFFLFFPLLLFRKSRDLACRINKDISSPVSDFHMNLSGSVSAALDVLARLEAFFIRKRIFLPFGVSLFCVVKKTTQ